MVEIYNHDSLMFGTDNPDTLMHISKVIAEFAKELNNNQGINEEKIRLKNEYDNLSIDELKRLHKNLKKLIMF